MLSAYAGFLLIIRGRQRAYCRLKRRCLRWHAGVMNSVGLYQVDMWKDVHSVLVRLGGYGRGGSGNNGLGDALVSLG